MGFCYLNSVAIAALEAQALGFKRVAVYDFDVHHGNGTENILLDREGLAFISIHQYPAYPGSAGRTGEPIALIFPSLQERRVWNTGPFWKRHSMC